MSHIRRHLTYANVMATIAVFLVLGGGTAVALNGSNTVQSDDLGPGAQVKAPDVAANAVNGSDVVNNSLGGADVNESSLGTVPNASQVGGLPPSSLTKGRAVTRSNCNPPANGIADCGTLTINLDRFSRLFVVARASWNGLNDAGDGTPGAADAGVCRIGVNGAPFGPDVEFGEIDDSHSLAGVTPGEVTLTNMVDPNLGPGPHTIGLACKQGFNGVQTVSLTDITLSVGVLGSD